MSNENEDQMEATSESDDDSMDENEEEKQDGEDGPTTYLPGQPLKEDEQLVCDQSAYIMLHQAQTGAPCLSFDIIEDNLGANRDTFPMTAYMVAGTQASSAHLNNLIIVKMSNLHSTSKPDDEESDSEDDEEEDEEKKPQMTFAFIKHQGCVNRIRTTNFKNSVLAASWSELGRVDIWNITQQLQAVDEPALLERYNLDIIKNPVKPMYSFNGHQQEGFGLDWCPTESGVLATGDCRRDIHIWRPTESSWSVEQRPMVGHTASVEDLQWSPNERNVLASCSVDKTIRIWDTRAAPHKACMLTAENAHKNDVNVISWNGKEPFIASGGDDGFLHIWDLRQFAAGTPVASFKHHTAPVTSVQWHWTEPSVLASAGEDHQVALWDLAVERDDDEVVDEELKNLPPQLLFIHQGQSDIKELRWHRQLPGVIVTTAHTGFNIFKTISHSLSKHVVLQPTLEQRSSVISKISRDVPTPNAPQPYYHEGLSHMYSIWNYWMSKEPDNFGLLYTNKKYEPRWYKEIIKKLFCASHHCLSAIVRLTEIQLFPLPKAEWAEKITQDLKDDLFVSIKIT